MFCPNCEAVELAEDKYEGVAVDKCPSCFGIWLDDGEIVQIIKSKEVEISSDLVEKTITNAFKGIPDKEISQKKQCPKCSKNLKVLNYDYSSGIIIDRCPEGHGIWLDNGEVEKVQAHREEWERKSVLKAKEWQKLVDKVEYSKPEKESLIVSIFQKILGL